jgi:hypothetical protein
MWVGDEVRTCEGRGGGERGKKDGNLKRGMKSGEGGY